MKIDIIEQRLNALEDLNKNWTKVEEFRKGIKNLPDIERICSRIY